MEFSVSSNYKSEFHTDFGRGQRARKPNSRFEGFDLFKEKAHKPNQEPKSGKTPRALHERKLELARESRRKDWTTSSEEANSDEMGFGFDGMELDLFPKETQLSGSGTFFRSDLFQSGGHMPLPSSPFTFQTDPAKPPVVAIWEPYQSEGMQDDWIDCT